ncbi:hypothetical protein QE377_003229 [Microbacterium sp. SORGH_AS 862]|nr:hypothetical protein [Microbacterium sp. SORGH_AS_0862]
MHDTESVGDESVAERGELLREGAALVRILRGLSGVEAEVLDDGDVAVGQRGYRFLRRDADGVACEGDGLAEQLGQSLRDRLEAVLRVGFAVGTPEVGADDDAGALVDQGVEGRQRSPHATVVRDDPVLERNVEVSTDDDAAACERPQRIEGAQCHGVDQRRSATYSVRSTRRLE